MDWYWWENLWTDIRDYVSSCLKCQKRYMTHSEEELHPTWMDRPWKKVGIDIVSMESCWGFSKLVITRCHATGYPEGHALRHGTSAQVTKFLYEDVLCYHGIFDVLVTDRGPENEGFLAELVKTYGIRHVITSAYHPQGNSLVERGHKPIIDVLSKLMKRGKGD